MPGARRLALGLPRLGATAAVAAGAGRRGVDAYMRGLVARSLAGVKLVSSDAHPGPVDAIAATLPGASWQRCRTHFMRNLLTCVPRSAQSFVATMARTIFAQPDAATTLDEPEEVIAIAAAT